MKHTYGAAAWYLPGGKLKTRETLVDGLRRELAEEVGLRLAEQAVPELLGVYSNFREGKSDYITVFVVRDWGMIGRQDFEISTSAFFELSELPEETSPGTRRRLVELRDRRSRSYRW